MVSQYAEQVWLLEQVLASAFASAEARVDITSLYNLRTLSDLQALVAGGRPNPPLDFPSLLSTVLRRNISASAEIVVAVPDYFRKLGRIVASAPRDVLASYIVWTVVSDRAKYAPRCVAGLLNANQKK